MRPDEAPSIAAMLGDLRCARCGYNLRGLSVRAVCPECGTPVRGTLLAVVDPLAGELQPMLLPRAAAAALVLWAVGALGAGLSVWLLRIFDIVNPPGVPFAPLPWLPLAPAGLAVVSGLGAIALIRPHANIPRPQVIQAATGVVAYVPLVAILWYIHGHMDVISPRPYDMAPGGDGMLRTLVRLLEALVLAVAILALRPNARLLASRSMLMRTGRVDRQTLLVMVGALGLASLGDVLRLTSAGAMSELVSQLGVYLIAVGSLLLTIGLVGVLVDAVRISRVIVSPPLSIRDVVLPPGASLP